MQAMMMNMQGMGGGMGTGGMGGAMTNWGSGGGAMMPAMGMGGGGAAAAPPKSSGPVAPNCNLYLYHLPPTWGDEGMRYRERMYTEGMYTERECRQRYRERMYTECIRRGNVYGDTERECTQNVYRYRERMYTHAHIRTHAQTHKRTHTYLDHLSPRGVMTVGEGNGEELNPKP
jgi:hypothetical protein